MKKLLRRCTAALLAAGTIWVVAATAESSSAAAAVSAMRDSFHLQRLLVQLELGGAARKKGMNLSTLLCLGQSPLLWAAYGALPGGGAGACAEARGACARAAATGPVEGDAAAGLTFADNGAPSQTVIPSSGKSYTVAGNVYIKNSSDYTLDPAALDGTFPAKLGSARCAPGADPAHSRQRGLHYARRGGIHPQRQLSHGGYGKEYDPHRG